MHLCVVALVLPKLVASNLNKKKNKMETAPVYNPSTSLFTQFLGIKSFYIYTENAYKRRGALQQLMMSFLSLWKRTSVHESEARAQSW